MSKLERENHWREPVAQAANSTRRLTDRKLIEQSIEMVRETQLLVQKSNESLKHIQELVKRTRERIERSRNGQRSTAEKNQIQHLTPESIGRGYPEKLPTCLTLISSSPSERGR